MPLMMNVVESQTELYRESCRNGWKGRGCLGRYLCYSFRFCATIANVGVMAVGLSFSNTQICPQN